MPKSVCESGQTHRYTRVSLPSDFSHLLDILHPHQTFYSSQSITSNFYCEVLSHHAVSSSQISVDKLVGIEVSHAISNLSSHLQHLL